jgi:hypothetical protein
MKNSWIYRKSLLFEQLQNVANIRLRLRKPIWIDDPGPTNDCFLILERWKETWSASTPVREHIISDPTIKPPGFSLKRHEWVLINRFRPGQGKCAFLMNRWGFEDPGSCDCGHPQQTMYHIVNDCPLRSFDGGLTMLHEVYYQYQRP